MRLVDRIPHSAMLETRDERVHPPVRPFHFKLRTRWHIITLRRPTTWREVWRDCVYLVRG